MASDKLNLKQQCFVEEYLVDLNATQAAIRAGYSKKTAEVQGCRLLRNAQVRVAVTAGAEKRTKRTKVDQDWVVERLVRNHDRAMTEERILDSDGQPTGEYRYNGAVANKSLELLGRHLQMFADRSIIEPSDALAEMLGIIAERPRPVLPQSMRRANGQGNGASG